MTQTLLDLYRDSARSTSSYDDWNVLEKVWRRSVIETLHERKLTVTQIPKLPEPDGVKTTRFVPFWRSVSDESLIEISEALNILVVAPAPEDWPLSRAIAHTYLAGAKIHDLASYYRVSPARVVCCLEEEGVKSRPVGGKTAPKRERNQQIIEMRRHGATLQEVAVKFGITRQAVSFICKRASKPV